MASENLNVLPIPADVITSVTNLFSQIQTALAPYLLTLTDEERRTIAKMSDKSVSFVTKVNDYAGSNPQFVPSFMSAPNLKVDIDNYDTLHPLLNTAEQIANSISDTAMVAGSEAYMAALLYYNSVKMGDKTGVNGARQIYEDLSKRFPGRTKKEAAPAA